MIQIHKHRLDRERSESSPEEIVGVLVDKKLNMTQQCTLFSPERQINFLDCTKSSVGS